ncbi:MAG: nuclear transport factor 2 family protein [Deltaproteobacteria bacterium]|nr:nuclear transport factor 2 family protein [Deltaproteobacteria bacterium]
MWKAGAAISAVLATAVPGMVRTSFKEDTNLNARVERRSKQVGLLEDEKAIRSLHRAYENYLDNGEYKEAVNLFTDDAEVIFNGGAFKDKRNGIYRLYCDHFKTGLTGKKMDSAPGFQLNAENRKILFGSPQIATRQRPDSPIPYRLGPL